MLIVEQYQTFEKKAGIEALSLEVFKRHIDAELRDMV